MSFTDLIRAHQRLILLRVLAAQPEYRANDSYLHGTLDAHGLPAARSHMHSLLGWLADQGLVRLDGLDGALVPVLTAAGLDVAAGRLLLEGVQRPGPERLIETAAALSAAPVDAAATDP